MTQETTALYEAIQQALLEPEFLQAAGLDRQDMQQWIQTMQLSKKTNALWACRSEDGWFYSPAVLQVLQTASVWQQVPEGGWLAYCYCSVLARLFPSTGAQWTCWDGTPVMHGDAEPYRLGRLFFMQILRGLYRYEERNNAFNPTKQFHFLSYEEVIRQGYTSEYPVMKRIFADEYIYEFMRIGADISPFNTLGHIAGVHYTAVYAAQQLAQAGVPVDTALISGAAACHDLGKYGCKKNEEKVFREIF